MGERGIATLVIVAVVVIAVVAATGASYFLFIAKPAPGGSSENQPGGGAEEMGIPIYPGASGSSIQSDMKSGLGIPANVACEGYTTSAGAEDVVGWYKEQMDNWTLENETSFSPPDQPGITIYTQHYRKDDNGAFIFAMYISQMGGTIFGIATGPLSSIQGCGTGGPPDGGLGDNQPGGSSSENVYVDWSGAQVLTDPKGDFWLGSGSPPQVIQFPSSDIIRVYMTNDNQYLYIIFDVDGAIPTFPLTYNGDTVRILAMDLVIDSDQNTSTGNIMYSNGGDLMIDLWFGSPENADGVLHTFAKYAFYDPEGDEYVGDWVNETFIGGGVGENFAAARFTLSGLGLESGMRINVFATVEAESDLYHHFARDTMPAEGQWNTNIDIS